MSTASIFKLTHYLQSLHNIRYRKSQTAMFAGEMTSLSVMTGPSPPPIAKSAYW